MRDFAKLKEAVVKVCELYRFLDYDSASPVDMDSALHHTLIEGIKYLHMGDPSDSDRDYYKKLESCSDFSSLLRTVFEFEKILYGHINSVLDGVELPSESEIDKDSIPEKYVFKFGPCLKIIRDLNYLFFEAMPLLEDEVDDRIKFIVSNIKLLPFDFIKVENVENPCMKEIYLAARAKEEIFLGKMRNFIQLALMKLNLTEQGAHLIENLSKCAASIAKEYPEVGGLIQLRFFYDVSGSVSLKVEEFDEGGLAIDKSVADDRSLDERLRAVEKGQGEPSRLYFPLIVKGKRMRIHLEDQENEDGVKQERFSEFIADRDGADFAAFYFSQGDLQEHMPALMMGSFSFDTSKKIYYTPAFIEIGHELIHIWHSAEGLNLGDISFSTEEEKIWTDAEEYWTIQGGDITENGIAEGVTKKRMGHNGICIADYLNQQPLPSVTFSQEMVLEKEKLDEKLSDIEEDSMFS